MSSHAVPACAAPPITAIAAAIIVLDIASYFPLAPRRAARAVTDGGVERSARRA